MIRTEDTLSNYEYVINYNKRGSRINREYTVGGRAIYACMQYGIAHHKRDPTKTLQKMLWYACYVALTLSPKHYVLWNGSLLQPMSPSRICFVVPYRLIHINLLFITIIHTGKTRMPTSHHILLRLWNTSQLGIG